MLQLMFIHTPLQVARPVATTSYPPIWMCNLLAEADRHKVYGVLNAKKQVMVLKLEDVEQWNETRI